MSINMLNDPVTVHVFPSSVVIIQSLISVLLFFSKLLRIYDMIGFHYFSHESKAMLVNIDRAENCLPGFQRVDSNGSSCCSLVTALSVDGADSSGVSRCRMNEKVICSLIVSL